MRLKGKWQRSSLGHRRDLWELRRIKRRQEGEEVREYDQPTDSFLVAGKEERKSAGFLQTLREPPSSPSVGIRWEVLSDPMI